MPSSEGIFIGIADISGVIIVVAWQYSGQKLFFSGWKKIFGGRNYIFSGRNKSRVLKNKGALLYDKGSLFDNKRSLIWNNLGLFLNKVPLMVVRAINWKIIFSQFCCHAATDLSKDIYIKAFRSVAATWQNGSKKCQGEKGGRTP